MIALPSDADLHAKVVEVLDRWPSAGLAVGVVRDGSLAWFRGYGVADVGSGTPVTPDTVFRVGSVTKTFTAVGVMQLREQGLVDLDAPANDYLREVRLVPASDRFRPATVRHLLTHTSGIGYWRRLSDLLRPGWGSGVQTRGPVLPLAEYYARGLPVEVQPGTKWTYSNHGFAVLGQIIEDVSGQPLGAYLHDHLFEPLGMRHTGLVLSEPMRPLLAGGYVLGSHGLRRVVDRDMPAVGAGAAYSTTADLARYVAALLALGAGDPDSVLAPATAAAMFEPHFQPDPRAAGMGLGFLLDDESGHRVVGHDGIMSGFLSQMTFAPDDAVGVVVLANTGGLDGRGAPEPLGTAILRRLLGLPDDPVRHDVPAHPEVWGEVRGWYAPDPGPVTNLFTRALFGAGAEVVVRRGELLLKGLTPVPAMRRGLLLHPDDPDDPYVFRVDFADLGKGTLPVVFSGFDAATTTPRLLLNGMSLRKRPDVRNPRAWVTGALAGGTAAVALRRGLRRRPVDGSHAG